MTNSELLHEELLLWLDNECLSFSNPKKQSKTSQEPWIKNPPAKLAWRIAMGLQSMGSQKVHATKHTAHTDLVKDQKLKWGFSG